MKQETYVMKQLVQAPAPGRKISQKWLNMIGFVAVASLLLTACSKNNDLAAPGGLKPPTLAVTIPSTNTWQGLTGPGGFTGDSIKYDGSVYSVKDFKQTYNGTGGEPPAGNFYFSFWNNSGTLANDSADLHFSGIATGDITTLNAGDELRYIDASFSSVTDASWSSASTPDNNTIGMNQVIGTNVPPFVQAYANSKGWYIYYWDNHTVAPVAGRVLLLKKRSTAPYNAGKIYKFQFSSMYLTGTTSFPYFSFSYKLLN